MKKSAMFVAGSLISLALGISVPAHAQDGQGADAAPAEDDVVISDEEDDSLITVTGSRIRLPNLKPTEPTTTIDAEYINQRNFTNIADALNDLPQIRGSVTANGGQAAFGQGVNFINNFGLGTNRTLTLINGRRLVSSNTPSLFGPAAPGLQVDLNVIPVALVKQTDIISTAGAPIYGSDAISGTVNLILDDRYEGLNLIATSSLTEEGDNFSYRFEGVYGTSFADGRGHLQLSSFYTQSNGVLQRERQFFLDEVEAQNNTILSGRIDTNLPLDTGVADGVPATVIFSGSRLFGLSNNGVIVGGPLGVSTAGGAINGLSGTGAFQFDAQGNLIPFNVGTRPLNVTRTAAVGLRGIGGDGFQFSDFGQLTSDLRRFGANVFANYDVTDNINFFLEAQYYDARADELVQQPTFNSTLFGGASGALTFQTSNPFLNDQARGILTSAGVTSFTVGRANVGFADLTGFAETQLLRGVVGARGDLELLGNNWNWEGSFVYGQTEVADFRQDINLQNFVNATNVIRNGAGQIVCNPTPTTPAQAGFLPVADPRCVAFNFFGLQASPEALDYVVNDSVSNSTIEQIVFNANLGGTLFKLNDNEVGVNLGYEHREESGNFNPSEFDRLGLGRGAAVTPISGSFVLNEVFGEIYTPIITPDNEAFLESVIVYGRGRYVDNSINGGFFSWAAGGSIAPIADVEIRGNFTRSFRAPALAELFLPRANAFAAIPDLCFGAAITAGANPAARQRNCNAFLAAFPNISRPQIASQATIPIIVGGNTALENEQSNSWSVGGIIRPSFVSNLSITVDYIDISISQPIANLNAAAINVACFDNDSFDLNDPANGNEFCSLIRRQPNGEVVSDAANPGVVSGFINGNAIDYRGIQASGLYSTKLEGIGVPGTLSLRGDLTVVLFRQTDITGVAPARADGELGDPQFAAQATVNYTDEHWGFGTVVNYTGEQLFSRFSRTPDTRQFDQLEDYVTVDFNIFFETKNDFRMNFVVNNLFNRQCERLNGFCIPNSINDAFGRSFSVSLNKKF